MEVVDAVRANANPVLCQKFQASLTVIHRALTLYSPHQVAFSFNGGKDSTVLLHILRAAIAQQATVDEAPPSPLGAIKSFVFDDANEFEEIRSFTRAQIDKWTMNCRVFPTSVKFAEGLQELVDKHDLKACILGTRRGDPNADGQDVFCPSSPGWPAFMRINPILDWTYEDVWAFLLAEGTAAECEYCSLYDAGYTSIGGKHNTLPNATLKLADGSYAPAFKLVDGGQERSGRTNNNKAEASPGQRGLQRTSSKGRLVEVMRGTVGVLVVGGEILAGRVRRSWANALRVPACIQDEQNPNGSKPTLIAHRVKDENSHFLCKQLRALGCDVGRVVVVPDCVSQIASEVTLMRAAYDLVVTTGGTGPTLDDKTMAGVAAALGRRLTRHAQLEERLQRFYGAQLTDAHLRMALVPEGEVELLEEEDGSESPFPLVLIDRSLYVLPGVPHLCRHQFPLMQRQLKRDMESDPSVVPMRMRALLVKGSSYDEAYFARMLDECQLQAKSKCMEVLLGSYPMSNRDDGLGIKLTVEGREKAHVNATMDMIMSKLPEGTEVKEEISSNRSSFEGIMKV